MANKKNLDLAKKNKKDEFYTQIEDIENELGHYKKHFKNKVVFLNCDDPDWSNFWKYFSLNFEFLGIKKLISTHFSASEKSYKLEMTKNGETKRIDLMQNGDFRSPECIEILKEVDIVVTNPPFSLFREYVSQLMEYNKKFVIIGHQNAISYKEIFPLIKQNKIWLGYGFKGGAAHFKTKNYKDYASAGNHKEGMIRVSGVHWFTNLDINKRHEEIFLFKKFNEDDYPKYDNFKAINIDKTKDIPVDYDGLMGVPITFVDKYNPDQFEIVTLGVGEHNFTPTKKYDKFYDPETKLPTSHKRDYLLYVKSENGKYLTSDGYRLEKKYARVIIRRK